MQQTRTFTLLVTIDAEPGHPAFDTTHLADLVQGALETGQVVCVIKGCPGVRTPPVHAATAHAFTDDRLECKPGTVGYSAANGSGSIKRLHAELRKA